MILYQCSFCEFSFCSDEKRKEHEEICDKNVKTEQERFNKKKYLAEKKKKNKLCNRFQADGQKMRVDFLPV